MRSAMRFWLMFAVLAISGTALHVMSHGEAVPISQPLSHLPKEIGRYSGTDYVLDQRVLDSLKVDDYLNRMYQTTDDHFVGLYIGYYKSQQTGQLIHSPKNCLPGAGWQPVRAERVRVQLADGRLVPMNLYVVQKGLEKLLVMYWYQSHVRIIASEYWGKYYLVRDAIRLHRTDAALVRITTDLSPDENEARARAEDFARQLMPELKGEIPQ